MDSNNISSNMENKNQSSEVTESVEFICQDDSKTENSVNCNIDQNTQDDEDDESNYKYTNIDKLDEDPVIPGMKYALVSFVSPEGLMNCKIRGFKIRGVYGSYSEAQAGLKLLQKNDKYFDIYICEVGKWMPWDPSHEQVKKTVYKGKDQNAIMKNLQEKELKQLRQLNETVGRHKENIDKGKVSHKERIANAMKQNISSFKDQKEADKNRNDEEDEKIAKIDKARKNGMKSAKPSEKGRESVRDRLRRNVDQNEEKKRNSYPTESLTEQKLKLESETNRIKEQEDATKKMQQRSLEVDARIAKMREMLNLKKNEKKA